MKSSKPVVVYWDSSAILSGLFKDAHTREALGWSQKEGYHFISTLAWAEVMAVIARIRRERMAANVLIEAALESLEEGPWRRLNYWPPWETTKNLAGKWPLHGADLWHLSTALAMAKERPELILLTFDKVLMAAAAGEGLSVRKAEKYHR